MALWKEPAHTKVQAVVLTPELTKMTGLMATDS